MASLDINIDGYDLTVYYTCDIERDAYGTGDSPSNYDIDLTEVELADSVINILELLPNRMIDKIYDEIIAEESM